MMIKRTKDKLFTKSCSFFKKLPSSFLKDFEIFECFSQHGFSIGHPLKVEDNLALFYSFIVLKQDERLMLSIQI